MTLFQHNTLFCLYVFLSCAARALAYPQQTSSPTPTTNSPTASTPSGASLITAVISTVAVGGFNIGGLTASSPEKKTTDIQLVGIDSEKSETTYSKVFILSDPIFTTTTDASGEMEVIPDTAVPGRLYTEIDILVENASGYYISGSVYASNPPSGQPTLESNYLTCAFDGTGHGACSGYDVRIYDTTTATFTDGMSGTLVGSTMTLAAPVNAATTSASTSPSGSGSGVGSAPGAQGGTSSNGANSKRLRDSFANPLVMLLAVPVIVLASSVW